MTDEARGQTLHASHTVGGIARQRYRTSSYNAMPFSSGFRFSGTSCPIAFRVVPTSESGTHPAFHGGPRRSTTWRWACSALAVRVPIHCTVPRGMIASSLFELLRKGGALAMRMLPPTFFFSPALYHYIVAYFFGLDPSRAAFDCCPMRARLPGRGWPAGSEGIPFFFVSHV